MICPKTVTYTQNSKTVYSAYSYGCLRPSALVEHSESRIKEAMGRVKGRLACARNTTSTASIISWLQ